MTNEKDNYQKLLGGLGGGAAPEGLCKAVISRVTTERSRSLKRRFELAVAALVASCGAAVAAVLVLANSLSTSGFWKFVSLAFSDGGTVLTYWQQFAMSLLESFSVPEMVLSLACVFAVLLSLKFLLKNKSAFFRPAQLQMA